VRDDLTLSDAGWSTIVFLSSGDADRNSNEDDQTCKREDQYLWHKSFPFEDLSANDEKTLGKYEAMLKLSHGNHAQTH
jgi:hypothetical protein